MRWTVSQLARLAGVSVRTLHHYDEVGLLRPSARSEAGYRLYADEDLARLQQVLIYRELELPLDQIARILDDPAFDARAALEMQRQLLVQKSVRAQVLITAVDAAIDRLDRVARGETTTMTEQEAQTLFDGFDPAAYEAEAQEKWGDTDAYRESRQRTASYGKRQWDAIKSEGRALYEALARAMAAGTSADDPAAMDIAEDHRRHIDRWFYSCPHAIHVELGEIYVNDPRFTANIDATRPGLAAYLRDAIRANASRADASPQ